MRTLQLRKARGAQPSPLTGKPRCVYAVVVEQWCKLHITAGALVCTVTLPWVRTVEDRTNSGNASASNPSCRHRRVRD
jgi:hypothetical protein